MLLAESFHQDPLTGAVLTLLVKEELDYLVVMEVQLEVVQEVMEAIFLAEVVEEVLEVLAAQAAWEAMVQVVVVVELDLVEELLLALEA